MHGAAYRRGDESTSEGAPAPPQRTTGQRHEEGKGRLACRKVGGCVSYVRGVDAQATHEGDEHAGAHADDDARDLRVRGGRLPDHTGDDQLLQPQHAGYWSVLHRGLGMVWACGSKTYITTNEGRQTDGKGVDVPELAARDEDLATHDQELDRGGTTRTNPSDQSAHSEPSWWVAVAALTWPPSTSW